jgi:hypothetical protein
MKRGQTGLVVVFVILLIVLAFSFYFYYFGVPKLTGKVVDERNVTLVEKENLADNLLVPESLKVYTAAGVETKQGFKVVNYNDKIVSVSCNFPPFQDLVPSSNCFTYDSDGQFVGLSGDVKILPGGNHVFTATVKPFSGIKIKRGSTETVVNIQPGEYSGDIELQAWFTEDQKKAVSVITIPVKIVVGE